MNYYERHLGDYAKDARHLTMLEHGAYTLLMDRYYATEQGIPADKAHRVAGARTAEECAAVDSVLEEFFRLVDGVWIKGRIELEIAKAAGRIDAARENGRKGGRPRKSEPDGLSKQTQQKPSGFYVGYENETQHEPNEKLTKHQAPNTNHQSPDLRTGDSQTEEYTHVATGAEAHVPLALCLRRAGFLDVTAMLDELREAARLGIDGADLIAVAMEGRRKRKKAPGRWAITTAIARHLAGDAVVQDGAAPPVNKQEQLEERNRRVGQAWAAQGSDRSEDDHAAD
ncbi:YdaU family protein [Dyella kyungheensis]|uniref:YdaU family protein n=1 Tax=Dyella kyungheensis TaxID=1242174 RepID=UPI003CF469D6